MHSYALLDLSHLHPSVIACVMGEHTETGRTSVVLWRQISSGLAAVAIFTVPSPTWGVTSVMCLVVVNLSGENDMV